MKLTKRISQSRRDFQGEFTCEFCNDVTQGSGYDDDYFYNEAIPKMTCKKCNKSTLSEGGSVTKITPIVPENLTL
jgi:transcription elongation factor Elf1